MQRKYIGIALFLVVAWHSSGVMAEVQNVGYYEKVGEDGDWTIYQLYRSLHLPGVEDEQGLSGDEAVNWGGGMGGDCDGVYPDPQLCPSAMNGQDIVGQSFNTTNSGDEDDVPDVVRVYGKRPERHVVIIRTGDGPGGGSQGIFRGTAGQQPSEPPVANCSADGIGDMGGLLTSEQQQLIADFLNSQAASDLWEASGFESQYTGFHARLEQGLYLLPGGGTLLPQNIENGPCHANWDPPANLPPGSIVVHTHPFADREPLEVCNSSGYYQNVPSNDDVATVYADANVALGLIIDADGIIVFTEDYEPVDSPDEMSFKGGQEGKCGFARQTD